MCPFVKTGLCPVGNCTCPECAVQQGSPSPHATAPMTTAIESHTLTLGTGDTMTDEKRQRGPRRQSAATRCPRKGLGALYRANKLAFEAKVDLAGLKLGDGDEVATGLGGLERLIEDERDRRYWEAWPERREFLVAELREIVGERPAEMLLDLALSDSPQRLMAAKYGMSEGRISQILSRADALLSRRLGRPVSCRTHARQVRAELQRRRDLDRAL